MSCSPTTTVVSVAALPAVIALHPEGDAVRELLAAKVSLHTTFELYPLPVVELGRALRKFITKDPETWRVSLMAPDLRNMLFQVALDLQGANHTRFRRVREILVQHVPLGNLTDTGEALVMSGQLLWLALRWAHFPELTSLEEQMVRTLNRLGDAFVIHRGAPTRTLVKVPGSN